MDLFFPSLKDRNKALAVDPMPLQLRNAAEFHNRRREVDVGDWYLRLSTALHVTWRPHKADRPDATFVKRPFATLHAVVIEVENDGIVEFA